VRNPGYPAAFLVTTGVLMHLTKLRARRQIRFAFDSPAMLENINRLADSRMAKIEHPDTLEYLLARMPCTELAKLRERMVRRLIRMKCLDRFRLYGHVLVAVDATGHLVFPERHCDKCLTQKQGGKTIYYHMVLEAKIVTENGLAISVATEFVENDDPEADKQDRELKAFHRLAAKPKLMFPRMRICMLLDGLYLCEPVLKTCRENRWAYVATFKEGSAPAAWRESRALMELEGENRLTRERDRLRQEFQWIEGIPFGEEEVNVLECVETLTTGESIRFVWGTSLPLSRRTVERVANGGGRLRWKIENEGFNEQRRRGHNMEHAFSANANAAKGYCILLQLAQPIEQLTREGNVISRAIGGAIGEIIGGVRALAGYLEEGLRVRLVPAEAFDVEAARRIQIRLVET